MNTVTSQLHTLIGNMSRDEKRFFRQYLSLWVFDKKEDDEMDYLFSLYEEKEPAHRHTGQAERLWNIVLASLRLYESTDDRLMDFYYRRADASRLLELGLTKRSAKLAELLIQEAEEAKEFWVASEMCHQPVFMAISGILPKNASTEQIDTVYRQELEFLEKAMEELS